MTTSIFSLLLINASFSSVRSFISTLVFSSFSLSDISNSSPCTTFSSCSTISSPNVITSNSLDFFFLANSLYIVLAAASLSSRISKPISLVRILPDSLVVKPIKSSRFFSVANTNISKSFSLPIVSFSFLVVCLASSSFNSSSSPSGNIL